MGNEVGNRGGRNDSMNIKRAKDEIKHTIQAYLAKDEFGEYKIPSSSQRPMLLIGPPGIGKTAIMEQVASECKIGLVSYTITHHTRQSAVGLPYIEKKLYGDKEYSITEYTMSEIIAAVYQKMEETGLQEGILFIDEINCVSETLAATMLQFLQQKTFGNHKVPKGWIIVTAGNPPEYNKSVRDFDLVTLDRIRKLEVTEDYRVWKKYAYKNSVHGAVITYLDLKNENFYRIETTVDGVSFVTARGWEDLSKLLYLYEELGMQIDETLIYQYLQHKKVAKDFANYLDFYYKYKKDYEIDQLLSGELTQDVIDRFGKAAFDEKLTLIGLILDQLYHQFKEVSYKDMYTKELFECLKQLKGNLSELESSEAKVTSSSKTSKNGENPVYTILEQLMDHVQQMVSQKKSTWHMDKGEERAWAKVVETLANYQKEIKLQQFLTGTEAFEWIRQEFESVKDDRKDSIEQASKALDEGFSVVEKCFGISQELVIFLTELTMNAYSANFIGSYGNQKYEQFSKELMFQQKNDRIQAEIRDVFGEMRM